MNLFRELYNNDPQTKELFDWYFEAWDRQCKWMLENPQHFDKRCLKSTQDSALDDHHEKENKK